MCIIFQSLSKITRDIRPQILEIFDPLFEIRDEKDYMVLHTAILADVDILITGDKDFEDIKIERPEILTPKRFLEKY